VLIGAVIFIRSFITKSLGVMLNPATLGFTVKTKPEKEWLWNHRE
jgi:hypothetical protein